jgi:6-pyruvoyltetrahydropterin/6-carboxytetrahydropterin synthase
MPFQITTTRHFSAAHQLRLTDGSIEPTHGHNWVISITVSADVLDSMGVVMDFHELERLIDAVIGPWHNHHLNEVAPFSGGTNPSAENVALHAGRALAGRLPRQVALSEVRVWETPENAAAWRP